MALVLGMETQDIQVPPGVLSASLAMGLGVTLVAAALPAWQAGRISPLEALRIRGQRQEGWLIRHGWVLGIGLLAISTIVLILNPFPYDVQFRLGSLTVSFLFFGATLIIPASVGIWERLVRPLVKRIYGSGGRLGSSNIQRARLRTTLTVAALMIGASMILITRGMTDSFRGDLEVWINAYIGGDILVSSSLPMRSHIWRRLEAVEGVAAVAPIRYFEVVWEKPEGGTEDLTFMALDPAAHSRVTSFVFSDSQQDPQAALERLAAGDAVFISSVLSEKYKLQPGDRVRLRTRSGPHDFDVAAVVVDFFNQGLVIQGSWGDMRRYYKLDDISAFLVKTEPGSSVESVQNQIESLYGQRENLSTASNSSIIERALNLLQQAYSLFDVLALIAMFVAALGVVNTLTMNVIERTQEIGMLRSIGLTRRQVLFMILAEAGMMGMIGGALGLVFGIVLTRIFLLSMTAMSGYKITYSIPVQAAVVGFMIAFVVSQLAALMPARRAARLHVLEAIHYE
jgi:putative ABC transport system permease protein